MSEPDPFALEYSMGIHIPHLSPSTINSFITDKPGFYNSKVKRAPFSGSHATCRGTAVEHAINTWLETGVAENLSDIALAKYDEELMKTGCSKFDKTNIREEIPGMVEIAFKTYSAQFSDCREEVITQRRVEAELPGVSRKVMGYLDFFIMGKQVRDCKTSSKTPSGLSQSYILQGAFYNLATGLPVVFDYFIPNKTPVHKAIAMTPDQYLFGISYLTAAAKAIEELETCNSPRRVMELMSFPNLDAMWTYEDKIVAAKQWDIKM